VQQVVSQQLLAATLMEIGVSVDASTIALAESFSRVGVAITEPNISDARGLLGRMPGATPAAVALATVLGLPKSSGVLRALAAVVQGVPDEGGISQEALDQLTVLIHPNRNSEITANELRNMITRLSSSAENRIASREALNDDPRVALLALSRDNDADGPGMGANALAAHVEGQQVLNQAAQQNTPNAPLYFGFYATAPDGRSIPVEVQVKPDEDQRRRRDDDDAEPDTRTTVRIAPVRLGQIEVRLVSTPLGAMRCDVRAEKLATSRLLRRHAPDLSDALTRAGWDVQKMTVTQEKTFPPLWFGGENLAQPRSRMDWKA
jgi:hypothetical protein